MLIPSLKDNGTSTVFTRLPPDLRRKVDIALIERAPPTIMGVWLEFKLASHGVTYMSFYRYARRLRNRANVAELASLDEETNTNINPALNKLAARQLLEILLNEHDFEPRVLNFLTAILHRLNTADFQERDLAQRSSYADEKLKLDRAELNLKSKHLDLLRERFQLTQPNSENKHTLAHTSGRLPHPVSCSVDSNLQRAELLECHESKG